MSKKGFTLIELIVVIAIIAILSSLVVIAYQGYIKSAKSVQDKVNEKLYNHQLDIYLLENEIDKTRISASDIRDIIINQIGKEIVFKTNNKDNHFWFDTRDNSIVVSSIEKIKESKEDQPSTWALSYKPESIFYPYLLLDNKGDSFVELVMMFYDEPNYNNFNKISTKLINNEHKDYFYDVLKYNSFVGENKLYNYDDTKKHNIIVSQNITSIKANIFNGTDFERLYFPSHIKSLDNTSFDNTSNLKLVSFNSYINNLLYNNFNNSGVHQEDGLIINGDKYIYGTKHDSNYFSNGDGSIDNPYQIETEDQFLLMSNYHNKYFKLVNDLDLTDIRIDVPFDNVLDGNFHTIISNNLFNEISQNGVVMNLNVEHMNSSLTCTSENIIYGGLTNYNFGLIELVKIFGELSIDCNIDNMYVGGIAAYNYGSINKTINDLDIEVLSNSNVYLGGIVAFNEGSVSLVANDGKVKASGTNINVGGIIGYQNSNVTLNGLLNREIVYFGKGSKGSIGGFIGTSNSSVTVENSAIYDFLLLGLDNQKNVNFKQGVGNVINGKVTFNHIAFIDHVYVILCFGEHTLNDYYKNSNPNTFINYFNKFTDIYSSINGKLLFNFEND